MSNTHTHTHTHTCLVLVLHRVLLYCVWGGRSGVKLQPGSGCAPVCASCLLPRPSAAIGLCCWRLNPHLLHRRR
jgi:hypothetical protein